MSRELIVVLGKNIGVDSTGQDIAHDNFHLSTDSRMNTLAAGMVYTPGVEYLFATGKTAGENIPAESDSMIAYFKKHFPDVPNEVLHKDALSKDTAGNASETAFFLKEREYDSLALVTVGYHLENAGTLFERHGVPIARHIASESVVRERSSHHEKFVNEWESSTRVKKEKRKEVVRSLLLHVDRKGTLLSYITARTRG